MGDVSGGRMNNLLIGLFWAVCGIVWVLMHMDMAWLDSNFLIGAGFLFLAWYRLIKHVVEGK